MQKRIRMLALIAALVMFMAMFPGAAAGPVSQAATAWPPIEVDVGVQQDGNMATATISLRNIGDFDVDTFNVSGEVPRSARYVDSWAGSGRGFNAGLFNGNDVRWTNSGIKAGGRQGPFVYMFDTSGLSAGSSADVSAAVSWTGKTPGTAVSRAMAVRAGAAPAASAPAASAPAASAPAAPAASAPASSAAAPTLEWFGWSHFRLTSSDGLVILINPFITNNPDASITVDDITKADVILAADGHGDEQGDSIALAQKTGAKLIGGGFELGSWFIQQGVPASQVIRSSPGDRHRFGGVTVRVVSSIHGSGLPRPTIENPYGGPAAGFMITLENGFTVYFAGSTAATMDMQLWGAAFKPDLAILPLNGARDPFDVAQMVRLLRMDNPNLTRVIPHHQRVQQPAGATTVAEMADAIRSMVGPVASVMEPQRGQVIPLSK